MDDPADVFWAGIIVQRDTVVAAFPDSDSQRFVVKTQDGIDQDDFRQVHRIQPAPRPRPSPSRSLLDDQRAASQGFLLLFQGFMGLGLIIGNRRPRRESPSAPSSSGRQQIGMLRAIGYQRSMVAA